jgi:hypothetical protein
MKTAKIHVLALVVCFGILGGFAFAENASAQCVPDTPIGPSMRVCSDLMRATPPQVQPARTVLAVPVTEFIRNPVVVTASWIAARPGVAGTDRTALGARGLPNGSREARTPKRYAW